MIARLCSRGFSSLRKVIDKMMERDRLVWIDLEMTGLEVENDAILEAACIITKLDLNPIHEGFRVVIHQPEEILQSMNAWSLVQHAKSGLTFESRESKTSLPEADTALAQYIKLHADTGGKRYLAGNSVYMDKKFLEKYMPLSDGLLEYRLVDVSSLDVLCSHWYPVEYSQLRKKKKNHRALDDILESISQLKDFQQVMFKKI